MQIKYARVEIRKLHGFREATIGDADILTQWLREQILPNERNYEHLKVIVYQRCRELKIEPPTSERIDRIVRSATRAYEENFCARILSRLSPENRMLLDALLQLAPGEENERADGGESRPELQRTVWQLDAADLLIRIGGKSIDRSRYGREGERPRHKGYRAYLNRAAIYTLIETGMRRAAVRSLNLADVDFKRKSLSVVEKGGHTHRYQISAEGLSAIRDYIEREREVDEAALQSSALFLPASNNGSAKERLSVVTVDEIWKECARVAGVEGKTPHSARHAMGRHLIEKSGNIAAVQRQLGHKNAAYSIQYSRITADELTDALEDR